jgi:hypothetical protein
MGLEKRKRGIYYYKKLRIGNRVISKYVGGGLNALLAHNDAKINAEQRKAHRKKFIQDQKQIADLDKNIEEIFKLVDSLSTSELLLSGFHKHRGTWRKRRK